MYFLNNIYYFFLDLKNCLTDERFFIDEDGRIFRNYRHDIDIGYWEYKTEEVLCNSEEEYLHYKEKALEDMKEEKEYKLNKLSLERERETWRKKYNKIK